MAQAYLELRALQERLSLVHQAVAIEDRLLTLTKARLAEGEANDLDVDQLGDRLEATRTSLVPLHAQLFEQQDRIAFLVGTSPGVLDSELDPPRPVPLPPVAVPVGDPATLLRRRPDVRAAERRIEQQTALIGQRTADLFPKVTLVGDIGLGAADLGGVLAVSNITSTIAPMLQWSPFDFGRTRGRIAQAEALRDEALASYRRSVLAALEDAESALARYGCQAEHLAGLVRVQAYADRAARLIYLRAEGGTATTIDILYTERRRLDADADVVQARAQYTEDYVSLQKSLGLGWMSTAT